MFTLATLENPSFVAAEPQTFEDAKRVYNAINNPTLSINDVIDRAINVVNIAMRVEERINDDEEPYNKYYTTLLLDTGESVECTYTRFAKSAISILNTFGSPDVWNGAITVIPRRKTFSGGLHDTVVLDIA